MPTLTRILILCFGIIAVHTSGIAASDNTAIISIGKFNPDNYPDTLLGARDYSFPPRSRTGYRATRIHWGTGSGYSGNTVTYFSYPSWLLPKSSISVHKANQDTLDDIMLVFSGLEVVNGDSLPKSKAITVFGSAELDDIDTVFVHSVDSLQFTPYPALKMRKGQELTDPEYRDLSYIISYRMPILTTEVLGPEPPVVSTVADNTKPLNIQIFPNPASSILTVQANSIGDGQYFLRVFTQSGELIVERRCQANFLGEMREKLTFENTASGLYILQLSSETKVLGSYQFIIAQ